MLKVTVKNLKTGKVSEITESAWNLIKGSQQRKNFDLLSSPKKVQGKAAEEVVQNVSDVPEVDSNDDGKRSAEEMIKAIKQAESLEVLNVLIDGESRSTVLKAAQKRKSELNEQ